MLRSLLLVPALCLPLLAQEDAAAETDLARRFLAAYRAKATDEQTLLAAHPATDVAYTVVAEWLLNQGHRDAAAALAELRGGAPEGPGLRRLVETNARPSAAQAQAYGAARALLGNGQAAEALALLDRFQLLEGSAFDVRLSWLRAHAQLGAGRPAAAAEELRRCAHLARAVGWWQMARDAERLRVGHAQEGEDQASAADGWVEAADRIGDDRALLDALQVRYAVRLRRAGVAQAAGEDTAAGAARRQAREDLVASIELARRLGLSREQGVLLRNLAYVWHVYEGQPTKALQFYTEAADVLRGLGDAEEFPGVLLNAALVRTDVGQYADALKILDELLALDPAEGELRWRALGQRAYVLWRQGRLEKAAAAYATAVAGTPEGPARSRLRVQAAELHLMRVDTGAAARLLDEVLKTEPASAAALVQRAHLRSLRGDEEGARADMAAAESQASSPGARLLLAFQRIRLLRGWGRVQEALRHALDTLTVLSTPGFDDYGNAGALWVVVADLLLLEGRYEQTVVEEPKALAKGATLYYRINDPYRALPAYAQEMLVLVQLGRMSDATERLTVLQKMAEGTPSDRLRSAARAAEAIYQARASQAMDDPAERDRRRARAFELLDEAERHAVAAGDGVLEATALVNRALLDKDAAAELVRRAYARLDAARVDGPGLYPLVEGHRPDSAGSVAVAALAGAEPARGAAARDAFAFIERTKADRLLVALRGREAFLEAALEPGPMAAFVAARARLMEARAEGEAVAEAEAAFDAMVARLRAEAPAAAEVAFPGAPALGDVQAALRPDEAYLTMLEDPYARALVAVDAKDAVLIAFDSDRPLAGLEGILNGKKNVIVAPDGRWALRPLSTVDFGTGKAAETFSFFHVPSAAFLLRARTGTPPPAGEGAACVEAGPARLGAPLPAAPERRVGLLHLGGKAELDCRYPMAGRAGRDLLGWVREGCRADTVVVPAAQVVAGSRGEGVGALAAALQLAGAQRLVVSLAGSAPAELLDRFYAGCLDKGLAPAAALRNAQAWARGRKDLAQDALWAGLVLYGVP